MQVSVGHDKGLKELGEGWGGGVNTQVYHWGYATSMMRRLKRRQTKVEVKRPESFH